MIFNLNIYVLTLPSHLYIPSITVTRFEKIMGTIDWNDNRSEFSEFPLEFPTQREN